MPAAGGYNGDMNQMWNELEEFASARDLAVLAAGDTRALPEQATQGLPVGVALGKALDPRIVAGIADGPTQAYCDEYDRVNELLSDLALEAAELLKRAGHRALAFGATVTREQMDFQTLTGPFQHKTTATLSGQGWIGKCNLLVTRRFGSALRWSTVLTDAELPLSEPVLESACGSCRACVEVCPGGACLDVLWRQGMTREEVWDAWACLEGMKKINRSRDLSRTICGMCIAACPHTREYLRRSGALEE